MASDLISAALTQMQELVTELGGDPRALADRVGIDLAVVGAHDRFVAFSAVAALLGLAAAELGVDDFALRLAGRQSPDILGPVAIVARNTATVGAALQSIIEYSHVYSPAMATHLHRHPTTVEYEFRTLLRRLPFCEHIVELALGVTLSAFTMLAGPGFHPARVTFVHPPLSDRSVYTDRFDCPVDFEQERNAMYFPQGLMHRALPDVDPLARDLAVRFMAGSDRRDSLADAVAEVVKRSLPVGAATLPRVSHLMAMHPRALQRQLSESGTTFEEIVDQVRRDMVDGLLANRSVSLSAIARQLGYTEQSSLTRSVKRWFGTTPMARRRELRDNPGVSTGSPRHSHAR
ncbi:AraC family transcriptional regulator ligand-binding domain-containing protein [Gordonia sp. L191]|uniref:AraC family transcriptional regulator n=1 Tax=Gordonia sp. L191 TaxID=2982699 RepID=UPI0024BF1CFA|nr:AraC family transcriptional regulator [Gordonia sp. L191]WHU47633.1 AraC family transcriptional regulator ligand-binding domain-containing protein [Gordonia sp. L191]